MRAIALRSWRALSWRPRSRRGRSLSLPAPRRLGRRAALALGLCALLAAGYFFWFRDSGLVAVNRVSVSGISGPEAAAVRKALVGAAGAMTTLHVKHDELEAAARRFPSVRSLEVHTDFPGTLRIEVAQRHAAAIVGDSVVAADGTVLGRRSKAIKLPVLPGSKGDGGGRVTEHRTLRLLAVTGAAPQSLLGEIESVAETREHGIVVKLETGGPELRFGDPSRAAAKWAAAARVLADPGAAEAFYLDLRLPDRPAAGGLGPPPTAAPNPTAPPTP